MHDWLTGTRGGERVLMALADLLPGADLFTLIHAPGSVPPEIERLRIRTSFVNRLPGVRHYYRWCLPLFPMAAERLDLRGYDLIVSSSHCVAKGVHAPGVRHLSYCHTPMRYVWDQQEAYFPPARSGPVRRAITARLAAGLRAWDAATARRVDLFVANSENVRRRIQRCYGRDARVVHPPVCVERFAPVPDHTREDAWVCAGALVPYKRVDLAVEAFNASGRHLLVVGDGPEYRRLRRMARDNVVFTGRVGDDEMSAILARSRALIMPMVEDFGIIAVEAQAAGTPVIAYGAGGALETVIPGITGLHFGAQTAAALNAAVVRSERIRFDTAELRANAERFGIGVFRAGMRAALAALVPGTGPRRVATVA